MHRDTSVFQTSAMKLVQTALRLLSGTALLMLYLTPVSAQIHKRSSLLGHEAPPLIAPGMTNAAVDLGALRGQVVILNLWASWCPPCRAELPMLARLQQRHREEGLVLIALSADRHRDRDDARRALAGLSLTGAFMDGATQNGYANPEVLPITYVIGPDGVVRGEFLPGVGPLQESQLEALIIPLIAAKATRE